MTQTPQASPTALVHAQSDADRHMLAACFLGPYGENDTLLEKLMVESITRRSSELVRDTVRRANLRISASSVKRLADATDCQRMVRLMQ